MNSSARDSCVAWAATVVALLLFGPPLATAQDSEVVLDTYQSATATGSQSGSASASSSGSADLGEVWYDYDTDTVEYRTGCSVSIAEFASYDYVYTSLSGNPDPDVPAGSSSLMLTLDEYYCLFPIDQKEATFQEPVTEALNDPEFQSGTAGMSPEEQVDLLVPNATAADGLIGGHSEAVYAPAAGVGVDGHITLGTVLTGEIEMTQFLPDINPGANASPIDTVLNAAEDLPDPGPVPASAPTADSNGWLIIRTVLPVRYSYFDSDGTEWYFYPSGGCNMNAVADIAEYMTRTFRGGGSQRLDIDAFCYTKLRYPWDPCLRSDGTRYCTSSTYTIFDRFQDHVDAKMSWMTTRTNALVTSFIYKSTHNGIANLGGQYSLVSERAIWKPDAPHSSILMHEWGHNFGATHYPDDSYRKYYCRQKNSNGDWVYYDSVMNYCHMQHGWWRMDFHNYITVRANIW